MAVVSGGTGVDSAELAIAVSDGVTAADVIIASRTAGVITGLKDVNDVAVSGIASMTFAQMEALTADQLLALAGFPVHINDVHCNAAGIGGVYMVRDSSPAGWAQISKPWYYANVSDMPTGAGFTDFEFFATAVGLWGTKYKYDGTVFRLNQETSVIARKTTISKAIVLPTQGWTVSSVNTTSLAAGLLRLVGAGTHGLTAAQTTTPSAGTWIDITAGTGWTPGLYKINSVTDTTSNIIIEAASTANVPTVTSANSGGTSAPYIETVTIPPLNKYSELEVLLTIGITAAGGAGYFITPKISYDTFLMYAGGPTVGATAGSYTYYTALITMRNNDSVSAQVGVHSRLSASPAAAVAEDVQVGTVNSGVSQTLSLGVGSSIANQRVWLTGYEVRMRG